MKKIFLIISIFIIVFIIYFLNTDNKIYYFNIIDNRYNFKTYNNLIYSNLNKLERYVNFEKHNDYRITDLVRDINDNIRIDNKSIQNILIKADLITLKIGKNELNYKKSTKNINELFDYCDQLLGDLEKLLVVLRKYSKEKIVMIGYFNIYSEIDNSYFDYINEKTYKLCSKYDIYFINPNDILSYEDLDTRILNKKGHKIIGSKIKKIVANDFTF